MKLTPEQKAFYEYGRARGWLKAHRSKKYFVDVPDMGLYAWHLERDMHGLDALIRDAWQKRAACRAINGNRSHLCAECLHLPTDACRDCKWEFRSTRRKMIKSLWEPRKEGE